MKYLQNEWSPVAFFFASLHVGAKEAPERNWALAESGMRN